MYTVMLVDDESEIRNGMAELIKWQELGFELVGLASNGIDALELLNEQTPDVLITDIQMPYLNGIELATKVRELRPRTKIIFLSGFNDFAYAQKGIKLNIFDYLLKPISLEELSEVLRRLAAEFQQEQQTAHNLEATKVNYLENLELMRQSFLISLMTDEETAEVAEAQLTKLIQVYELALTGPAFLVIDVRIDVASFYQRNVLDNDLELSQFSVKNQLKTIVGKYLKGEVFAFSSNNVALLADEPEQIELFQEIITKELKETVADLFKFAIKIGVSSQFKHLHEGKRAFSEAVEMLNLNQGTELTYTDYQQEFPNELAYPLDNHREKKIMLAIKSGQRQELLSLLEQILNEARTSSLALNEIVVSQLYVLLQKYRIQYGVIQSGKSNILLKQFLQTIEQGDQDALKQPLIEGYLQLQEHVKRQRSSTSSSIGEQAYGYLLQHYDDADISLKSVAAYFAISTSYFSAVFKQTNQRSFTDALSRIRMEKAQELLVTSKHRIMEIANLVGFTDQHYFSYAFKKYYGVSPKMMRNRVSKTP